jgi:uncharacterized FlgJ-related protein
MSKTDLTYKPIKIKHFMMFLLIIAFVFSSIGFKAAAHYVTVEKVPVVLEPLENEKLTFEHVDKYLTDLNVRFKKIVLQQILFESSSFKSNITTQNNNIVGMRVSNSRITTSIGENLNFAVYKTWKDCILDYAFWQTSYARKIQTEQEYYDFLDEIYCDETSTNKTYSQHLKQVKIPR